MNEYTYVDMGSIPSRTTANANGPDETNTLKTETSLNGNFNYGLIEDDRNEKWKNMWLSDSKEQLDTTGLSAVVDLEDIEYDKTTSTFRTPNKHMSVHSSPLNAIEDDEDGDGDDGDATREIRTSSPQYAEINSAPKLDGFLSDPSVHEYAVPIVTPKHSASSSFDSLHDPSAPGGEPLPEVPEIHLSNMSPIQPDSIVGQEMHSFKPSKGPNRTTHKNRSNLKEGKDTEYIPFIVIYNEKTKDQLI